MQPTWFDDVLSKGAEATGRSLSRRSWLKRVADVTFKGSLVLALGLGNARKAWALAAAPAPRGQTPPPPPVPPRRAQQIYAPLPLGSWRDAELVLNNNSPGPITVTPIFFSEGVPTIGQAVTLQSAEVQWVLLTELATSTGRDVRANDGVELQYLGHPLEVGAQLTLLRPGRAGTVEVPFSAASEYRSAVQSGVAGASGRAGGDRRGKCVRRGGRGDARPAWTASASAASRPARKPHDRSVRPG